VPGPGTPLSGKGWGGTALPIVFLSYKIIFLNPMLFVPGPGFLFVRIFYIIASLGPYGKR